MRKVLTAFVVLCTCLVLQLSTVRAQFMDYLSYVALGLTNSAVTVTENPGPFLGYNCYNPNSTAVFVQLFDTTGSVTVGTTSPTRTIQILPAGPTGQQNISPPWSAVNGIKVAATTTQSGSTAPSTALNCEFYFR